MKQRYAFRILSMLLALVLVFELFPHRCIGSGNRNK